MRLSTVAQGRQEMQITCHEKRYQIYQQLIKAVQSFDGEDNTELKPCLVPEIKYKLSVIDRIVHVQRIPYCPTLMEIARVCIQSCMCTVSCS
jgi:hypothetical protein